MPMADYLCGTCSIHIEDFFHHPPDEIPCEAEGCTGTAVRTFEPQFSMRRPRRDAQRFSPVVIHRDSAGNVRFPGAPDAAVPAGFEKVELRTVAEVRQFERGMDAKERARFESGQAREADFYAERQRRDRAELRVAMQRMTPYGRDFARVAMEENDRKDAGRKTSYDPNFHVECFSMDSSNREAYRDERTNWRARKD